MVKLIVHCLDVVRVFEEDHLVPEERLDDQNARYDDDDDDEQDTASSSSDSDIDSAVAEDEDDEDYDEDNLNTVNGRPRVTNDCNGWVLMIYALLALNLSLVQSTDKSVAVTKRLIDKLFRLFKSLPWNWRKFGEYFLLLLNFAKLGHCQRQYLVSKNVIPWGMDLFLGKRSPNRTV